MIKNNRGMSLIEIIIVMAIIAGVLGMLAQRIFGNKDKANIQMAKAQIGTLAGQLEQYNSDCGFYPNTEQGLRALAEPPATEPTCGNWGPNPYLREKDLKDPWRNEFVYESDGTSYTIKSYGKDRQEGGEGLAADISSSDL
jgi:general secretion pathway protein G